ncbi:MAG: hypothetical protein M3546_13690 [Actinomycetota bacterium]|nr:hypothetical protein [Actinomycetota bacterium]
MRRKAREQAAPERAQERRARAAERELTSRRPHARGGLTAWLDERDQREPLTRADLHSWNDETAARVVDAGGGMQDVIDATDLRTRENVLGLIDPEILTRAFDNDALALVQPPPL